MNKPEAVVFDLGKVLVDFDYNIAARKIAARGSVAPEAVQHLIDHTPTLVRYETGLIDRHQFHREVSEATGYRGSIEEFVNSFADIFSPMDRMIELHTRLRERGLPTFIFSNTNDIAVAHIRQNFPFFAGFDDYVLSFEHGAMKPQPRLYEVVERVTGLNGERLLYIDDRAENVAAGAARGWQVIQQVEPEQTWREVQRLGLV